MTGFIRLCCGRPHVNESVACPDGKVWCCICFYRFEQDQLYTDSDGIKWDICLGCHDHEEQVKALLAKGICVCLKFTDTGTCIHLEDRDGTERG